MEEEEAAGGGDGGGHCCHDSREVQAHQWVCVRAEFLLLCGPRKQSNGILSNSEPREWLHCDTFFFFFLNGLSFFQRKGWNGWRWLVGKEWLCSYPFGVFSKG